MDNFGQIMKNRLLDISKVYRPGRQKFLQMPNEWTKFRNLKKKTYLSLVKFYVESPSTGNWCLQLKPLCILRWKQIENIIWDVLLNVGELCTTIDKIQVSHLLDNILIV
jgi:hypothetical protein